VLAAIAVVAVGGVLAILPYRLYERDIRHASVEAHRVSSIVHVALAHALARGEDPADLLNRFQGIADLDVSLRKLAPGESHPAAESRRGSSRRDGTDLTYVAPPILDAEGGTWLAQMHFDLAPMKRESIRLIVDLVLAVAIGSALFSAVVFFLVRYALVVPLRRVTAALDRLSGASQPTSLPRSGILEIADLARGIERLRERDGPAR
jgi:hypothetical protein